MKEEEQKMDFDEKEVESKGYFEYFYGLKKSLTKFASKRQDKRALRRMFESAIDRIDIKIAKAQIEIRREYSKLTEGESVEVDLNRVIELRKDIEDERQTKSLLISEYKEVFKKEPKLSEEED